ncbi:MAG: glycosyltransferase family 2 protein [Pseudomonadota bacterium]
MNTLIVIPCLNEEKNIERLVRQLSYNNKEQGIKIIIVDGGSTDGTRAVIRSLTEKHGNVLYLHNPKRIQSAGINLAVEKFGEGCEFIIRVDAHAEYPNDYCRTLIDEAQRTKADSVVVAMETRGITKFQKKVAAASNSKLGNGGSAHRSLGVKGHWVEHGHHALIRVEAFKKIGGYDENFSHNEDAEFDVRLQKIGFKIWLTDKTSIIYHPRNSATALFRQYINYGRGRVRTLLKHRRFPQLRQILPVAVAPAALLTIAAILLSSTMLAAPLFLWATLCISYGVMIAIKSDYISLLPVGLVAMIMHLAWSLGFWHGLIRETILKKA